ncbi:MAG: hypothetical protein R6U32_03890 [Candidatus Woesearchaeota archaeon]
MDDGDYMGKALNEADLSYCEKIIDPEMKGHCYGVVGRKLDKSMDICMNFDQEAKSSCLLVLAEDVSVCHEITGTIGNTTTKRKNACFTNFAEETNCASCQHVPPENKESCYNLCICSGARLSLEDEELKKQDEMYNVECEFNNEKMCYCRIDDKWGFSTVEIPAICDAFPPKFRSNCLISRAVYENDMGLCRELNGTDMETGRELSKVCFEKIAKETDCESCEYVEQEFSERCNDECNCNPLEERMEAKRVDGEPLYQNVTCKYQHRRDPAEGLPMCSCSYYQAGKGNIRGMGVHMDGEGPRR